MMPLWQKFQSGGHDEPQAPVCCRARASHSWKWRGKRRRNINDTGALACINDKWDEKEVDKGHKLVDYAVGA